MKTKLIRKASKEKKEKVFKYNVECASTGNNGRCKPGC